MRRHPIDQRASRYVARQCVADHGMHKDARKTESAEVLEFPIVVRPIRGRTIWPMKQNESGQC